MNRHIEDGVRLEQVCQLFRWRFMSFRRLLTALILKERFHGVDRENIVPLLAESLGLNQVRS